MSGAVLACSVRDCGLPLTHRGRALACSAGHSFDIARSGYINLLQPQDRRSRAAGDSKDAVHARAALEQAGVGRAVINAVVERVAALTLPVGAVAVDLGSGTGEMLGSLASARSISGIGVDLSVPAVEHASRRFPLLTWVVANADRRLPIQDSSVDVVLSIHGRRNPAECARVLQPHGVLIVALPAPDDLIELRSAVQGQGVERERVDGVLADHQAFFTALEHTSVRETIELKRPALLDLLRGTYRGARASNAGRVEALETLAVTFSSHLLTLRRT